MRGTIDCTEECMTADNFPLMNLNHRNRELDSGVKRRKEERRRELDILFSPDMTISSATAKITRYSLSTYLPFHFPMRQNL